MKLIIMQTLHYGPVRLILDLKHFTNLRTTIFCNLDKCKKCTKLLSCQFTTFLDSNVLHMTKCTCNPFFKSSGSIDHYSGRALQ